jgi:hypothetical protein
MGWKTGHARLTPEEAKAQLLTIAQERSSPSLFGRYPWRILAAALVGGFLVSRMTRLRPLAAIGAMWLVKKVVPLPGKSPSTGLDRLKARARRVG